MQLITLNIWGGHVEDPLSRFIESYQNIDIFCFQEVYKDATHCTSTDNRWVNLNIFSEINMLLPNHIGFFKPVVDNTYGIAMFVKKNLNILEEGEISIHDNPNYPGQGPEHSRNLQWVQLESCAIMNVHGLWNGQGKTDSFDRLAQSEKIKGFLDTLTTPKILCGDFNLRPDTESLEIFEDDMENLIKTYGVESTRTRFYPKSEKFADYIFVSPEIQVDKFEVLPDEVSDHAALLLEFSSPFSTGPCESTS